jgi:hypothetical protein
MTNPAAGTTAAEFGGHSVAVEGGNAVSRYSSRWLTFLSHYVNRSVLR